MSGWKIELPKRLLRNNRPVDKEIGDDHLFYRRFLKGEVQDGKLVATSIDVPKTSGNWSKYSTAEETLCPIYQGYGVARFRIGDLPSSAPRSPQADETCAMKLEHDPEKINYAHCAYNAYYPNSDSPRSEVSRTAKKFIQGELAKLSSVVIDPQMDRVAWIECKQERDSALEDYLQSISASLVDVDLQ